MHNLFFTTYMNDFQEFIKCLQVNIIMTYFEYRKQIIEITIEMVHSFIFVT
jgi:hypothetical protein